MQRERIEKIINDAIVANNAQTPVDRARIYDTARAAFRKKAEEGDKETSAILEKVIAEIEGTFAPPALSRWARTYRPILIGFVAGLIAAGGAYLVQAQHSLLSASEQRFSKRFDQALIDGAPQLPVAEAFLKELMDKVFARSKTDPAFQKSAASFVALATFDPELAKTQPKSLPPGSAVIIRADGKDVKVMLNWPLCGVAQIEKPALLDPVRSKADTIGCPYFGVWTDAAASW